MDFAQSFSEIQTGGLIISWMVLPLAAFLCLHSLVNLCGPPRLPHCSGKVIIAINCFLAVGFLLICLLHFRIHQTLALSLEPDLARWLNLQLDKMNGSSLYPMPLYDPAAPPRYSIPLWIENEKYYFWFMIYGVMAMIAHYRSLQPRFRALIHLVFSIKLLILFIWIDPFQNPLPRFFAEIGVWFQEFQAPMDKISAFMQLYPRMIFYYNTHYMWFHPPMLFISYSCIAITFCVSCCMFFRRDAELEVLGYGFAKFGYFMLTLGMLLGYPWALQAWGPNWWWDPKICSSIMMWLIYSTYLHCRLYLHKQGMWHFSAALGVICFLAMIFTFISSFFFPGEHTLQ